MATTYSQGTTSIIRRLDESTRISLKNAKKVVSDEADERVKEMPDIVVEKVCSFLPIVYEKRIALRAETYELFQCLIEICVY